MMLDLDTTVAYFAASLCATLAIAVFSLPAQEMLVAAQ